jgi:oligoendopeptidase F
MRSSYKQNSDISTRIPAEGSGQAASAAGSLPSWNLADLYSGIDSAEYASDCAKAAAEAESFEARWQGTLAAEAAKPDGGGLASAIAQFEFFEELIGRIMSFAGLSFFSNTSDPALAKFYGDAQEKMTDVGAHLLFFGLELNKIEDSAMDAAMDHDPALARYRPWIMDLRKAKPHQLEDKIEKLFLEQSIAGRAAWNRLFDETMSALRFAVDGQELALEAALNLLQDAEPEKRAAASDALAKTLGVNLRLFTQITNTLAKDKEISDRWHGFDDIADSRHLDNKVERAVVDALTEAVKSAYPRLSHRYYAMKAKWLGMEKLNTFDRNAPLPETPKAEIPWSDARDIVLDAYRGFSPQMADTAKLFFDKNWIDAAARPGKAPGAFAHPTVPSVHPYVLINYMGKPRDVMTLAHELGHGVHQVLAGKQGPLLSQTPLTLAETASVFGEMLTFRHLLTKTNDKRERKAMLAQKVEDMINTVVRQIAFYQFERKLHEARRKAELTSDEIGALWLSVQAESLGPSIRIGEGYETFWTYIPHFIHSPFYVYAYAFGDCLVNSLYAVYQQQPEGFQDKYFAMLEAGGTKHHSQLLAPFGLDASDPVFWSKGLAVIEGLIDELEALDRDIAKDAAKEST